MSVRQQDLDERLASRSFIDDPYPVYETLREEAPLFWSESWQAWVLTRYGDIVDVLLEPGRFSNAGRFARLLGQLPAELQPTVAPLRAHYASGILQCDPPDHGRIRGLVNRAFTPRAVVEVEPKVEHLVGELLDAGLARGQLDLVADFAKPLPAMVISEMLGVPSADRGLLMTLGDQLTGLQAAGAAQKTGARMAADAVVGLEDYFRELYQERREHPHDDLLSAMLAAHDRDDRLNENELVNTCVTILVAGHETTRNLIGNAAFTLSRRVDAWRELRADPALLESAVEEMLRFESPIQRGWRRVAGDTEIHSQPIKENELLFLMLGAANRDPRHFEDPEELNLRRTENRHLAFARGPHFCLGASLSRLETRVALGALLRRFDRLEALNEPRWNDSIHMRGIDSFQVDVRRAVG